MRGTLLVGRVLVEERRLKLVLQVGVGRIGEAFLVATLGVELDEVARNVLDALLRALLQLLPCAGAERAESGRFARVAAAVLRYLVERVDRHVDDVATLIVEAYHLLVGVADRHAHQAAELADAEVDVHDEVAGFHLLQLLHRECHLARSGSVRLQVVLVEAVEYLMVGEEAQTQVVVGEALVQSAVDGSEGEG